MEETIKGVVYARVSTDDDKQLNSLENQRNYYIDYFREKGWQLVEIYADEGITGTSVKKREDFKRMLYDAGINELVDSYSTRYIMSDREPKFNYIVTKDVSRFARNTNIMEVVKTLRKKGVYIYFQNADIDTKDENYQFLLNLFLNFSQQESIDRSQKVKFGLKQRAKEGKYHFGYDRLYGYIYDKDTKEFSLVEDEAETVKMIFDLYINDKIGSSQIAKILNQKSKKTVNGLKWTADAVVRALKQEKYTGSVNLLKYTYGDVTDENRSKTVKDPSEWVRHEELLPPIITADIYNKAQEIMSGRATDKHGINTPKNIFSKKLKCARCGKNYIRSNQKQGGKTYYFYSCATRRRLKECDNSTVTLIQLEEYMQPYCNGGLYEVLSKHRNALSSLIGKKVKLLESQKNSSGGNKDKLISEIEQKESEINGLFDSFLSSSDTVKKALERKIESLEKERTELERQLLSLDSDTFDSQIEKLKNLQKKIDNSIEKKTYTMEEVLDFIEYIHIDGKILKPEFSFAKLSGEGSSIDDELSKIGEDIFNLAKELRSKDEN